MSTTAKYYGMDDSLTACEWENSTDMFAMLPFVFLVLAILVGFLVSGLYLAFVVALFVHDVFMSILSPILVRVSIS